MVDKRVIDTIIAEALGEGDAGMTAVAYTILNRANNRGLTPLQVVKQKSQYSGYSNPGSSVKRAMDNPQVRARVESLWNAVQTGAVPDPTQGGEYFHTTSISPSWSKGVNKNGTTTVGNHVFYLGKGQSAPAAVDVPARRPESDTAVAAISRMLGTDAGVSGLGYAPPMPPLPTPAPMVPRKIANTVRPEMPGSLPSAPPPLPRLDEQTLTKWVESGAYQPTRTADSGLTTRKVNTVPVNPDGSVGAIPTTLQEYVEGEAQRRRDMLPGIPALPGSFLDKGPASWLDGENNVTMPPPKPQTLQPLPSPTLRPLSTEGVQVAQDLTPLPTGLNAFGYTDNTRLSPGAPLEPKLPYGPPMPPKTALPTLPLPGSLGAGVRMASLGAPLPLDAIGGWGVPSWMNKPKGVPPSQQMNPSAQQVVNGLGKTPTSSLMAMLTSPGAQMLGKMNTGQAPLAKFLASLFVPREQQVGTSLSVTQSGNQPVSTPDGRLSYASADDGLTEIQKMLGYK